MAVASGLLAGSSFLAQRKSGKLQQQAYEAEAEQAEMQAEFDELDRRRELNDALSMQAVMMAASGRAAGEGSTAAIVESDISRANQDIALNRATARSKAAGLRTAGIHARSGAKITGAIGAGKDLMSMYQAGAFDTKQVD